MKLDEYEARVAEASRDRDSSRFRGCVSRRIIGLSPKCDIDFVIDVIPRTKHVSRMPYRMGMSELKELKVQIQELLDKGFV